MAKEKKMGAVRGRTDEKFNDCRQLFTARSGSHD